MKIRRIDSPARAAGDFFCLSARFSGVLALVLVLSVALFAVGGTQTDAALDSTPTPEPMPEVAAATYPQTVIDALDREVTIDAQPASIVSLAPSVTETLFAIGAGPQVVGRTTYDTYPPEVEALPTIGGFSASSISVEAILALEPELVIAGTTRQAEIVEALEAVNKTVIVVDPASLAEIEDTILLLGMVTGHVEEATAVVTDMQARTVAVIETLSAVPQDERVTVFYEVWHEPLMTTTEATYIGELITLAGGINIFGDLDESYPTVSAEQIIELDPVVILGPDSHGDQLTQEMIAARPGWQDLTAVVEENIYLVDGEVISHSGPRVVDALESVAAILYPELFAEQE